MHLLARLLVNAVALYLIATCVPGVHAGGFVAALIAALIFGIINAIVRPIVLVLTFPITIATLGLFVLIVNALMFWLATWITPGFKVDGFTPALIGGLVMTAVSIVTNHLLKPRRRAVSASR